MKKPFIAALLAAGAVVLAVGAMTAYAGNGTINGTTHCNPADPTCGANPILTGPAPVSLPGNCPAFLSTDTWTLAFVDGNSVSHFTQNKNGDWGGGTAEGTAVLTSSEGTLEYTGHATEWFGGGQNSDPGGDPTQQSEMGFTLHFNGSGPAGTLDIHADGHSTTNNSGTLTNNFMNVNVSCS